MSIVTSDERLWKPACGQLLAPRNLQPEISYDLLIMLVMIMVMLIMKIMLVVIMIMLIMKIMRMMLNLPTAALNPVASSSVDP